MREAVSSILKVGLINSGMFDTLELNTDVRAIHLVGDNNVGKTSLIELIQFLYFPNLTEMHFSKSLTETMSFYFRREGSYVLFEVRTVRGTRRSLGVYGTGTADSRQVFVFDGTFELVDFLDDTRHVLPLERVAARLAGRRFHLYSRVEDHERALIGEHSSDQANIHVFDLSRTNFRLLRRLLQNLLRLERLTARDIRQFLNALVESTGAKTRIDVARDFERKYADTRIIRDRINSLLRLKPLIDQWIAASERAQRAQVGEHTARQRLGHAARCYIALLEDRHRDLGGRGASIGAALVRLDEDRRRLFRAIAALESQAGVLNDTLSELNRLELLCAGRSEDEVRAERDQVTHQAIELQLRIDQSGNVGVGQIDRRLRRAQDDRDQVRRQLESRAVIHLLAEADLSDSQRALLHFLIAERLLSLPLSEIVADAAALLAAAREATSLVDPAGVFRGFGLAVSRTIWYRPMAEEESLAERLAEYERRVVEAERELAIAQDRDQARQGVFALHRRRDELDRLVSAFQRQRELEERAGGAAAIARELVECQQRQRDLESQQSTLTEEVRTRQREQVDILSDLRELEHAINDARQVIDEIGAPTSEQPVDIASVTDAELPELFRLAREHHRDRRVELRRAQEALNDPRARLEELYEREASDSPFGAWIDEKRQLTDEVVRLEGQLRESYANLVTLVKGELDKLTQAFEVVRSRVAELNNSIRRVSISNIDRIELHVQESQLVEAIRQTSRLQLDMFAPLTGSLSLEAAEQQIEDYLVSTLRAHGRELNLDALFQLEFRVTYAETGEQRSVTEIHAFESNGTATGVKIVVYLGLIRLLQESRRSTFARIPFFLDEVGSLSSNNVRQIIAYCADHNFLPIFASPTIRSDIPHSYILQRVGDRSQLVNEVILTDRGILDEATPVDSPART